MALRPDAPKLLPQHYGRANYLRREVQLARDYMHLHPNGPGATDLAAFFDALATPLPATSAIVTDGQELEVDGGTVTLSVEDGEVSATFEASE
jgi:hypothetical protein